MGEAAWTGFEAIQPEPGAGTYLPHIDGDPWNRVLDGTFQMANVGLVSIK